MEDDTIIIDMLRTKIADKQQERAILVDSLRVLDDALKSFQRAEAVLNPQTSAARGQETTEVALRRIMQERQATDEPNATLMDLVDATGRQKNAVRSAVAKLVTDGFLEKTGELINRSPEYRLVPPGE